MAHIILLFLVAGENADLLEIGVQEVFENGGTEGAGTAGDHESSIIECNHADILLWLFGVQTRCCTTYGVSIYTFYIVFHKSD